RVSTVRDSIEQACATGATANLVDQLAQLDSTERALLAERRTRLAATRRRCIVAFVLAMLGAVAAVIVARLFPMCQRRLRQSLPDIFVPMGGEWFPKRA